MGRKLFFLLGIFFSLFIFFSPQKAIAADSDVVINEVMANAPTPESDLEWVEIYNSGLEPVNLNGWKFDSNTISDPLAIVEANNYLILARNKTAFTALWNIVTVPVIQIPMVLSNSGDTIQLQNDDGLYTEEFSWDSDTGDNVSWERIDPLGSDWAKSVLGGTPGSKNSAVLPPPPPDYPDEVLRLVNLENALILKTNVTSIIDGDTIEVSPVDGLPSKTVRLLYVDTPELHQPYYDLAKDFTSELLDQPVDLLISRDLDEQIDNSVYNRTLAVIIYNNQVFNTQLLEQGLASFYDDDNSVLKMNEWLVILKDAQQSEIGIWQSSSQLIFSELLPDPVGLDSEGEWVEIFNPTNESVVLSRYYLDNYSIPSGTTVNPMSFIVFHRNQTGITLGNSGDTVKLFFPGGLLINEASYGDSSEGLSWALIDNIWSWTSRLTPGEENILEIPNAGADDEELDNENIPINSSPIEIKTGDFRNYENYQVIIQGTITETSGNTFYVDDGSGKAKVYIQESTGIDKPPMHKGDIFRIIGIVNLYRNSWRILPQKNSDIELVDPADIQSKTTSTKTKKTTITKVATSKKTIPISKARSPGNNSVKKVASSSDIASEKIATPWWIQFIKMIVGIAIIFLVLFLIKIFLTPRVKPLGGDFGDET